VDSSGNKQHCDVIIVNYNVGTLLTECVRSAFTAGARQVIVVDNASRDQSLHFLQQHIDHPGLTIIRNTENVGFARACNIGAAHATADQLLFLNPDTTIDAQAIHKLLAVLHSHPRIGMVGGLLTNPDGTEQPGGRRLFPTPKRAFFRAFGLTYLSRWFPYVFPDYALHETALPTEPVMVEAISGACMLVKRAAIDEVGLWDDNYFLHCEDLDWCMRFHQRSWAIYFVPDAIITHVWRVSSSSRPFFVEWHKHHGMIRFYKKFFCTNTVSLESLVVMTGVWCRFLLVSTYHGSRIVFQKLGAARG
jgi:GT2 family glycosyltransferase